MQYYSDQTTRLLLYCYWEVSSYDSYIHPFIRVRVRAQIFMASNTVEVSGNSRERGTHPVAEGRVPHHLADATPLLLRPPSRCWAERVPSISWEVVDGQRATGGEAGCARSNEANLMHLKAAAAKGRTDGRTDETESVTERRGQPTATAECRMNFRDRGRARASALN